jgi:hypothetical protein
MAGIDLRRCVAVLLTISLVSGPLFAAAPTGCSKDCYQQSGGLCEADKACSQLAQPAQTSCCTTNVAARSCNHVCCHTESAPCAYRATCPEQAGTSCYLCCVAVLYPSASVPAARAERVQDTLLAAPQYVVASSDLSLLLAAHATRSPSPGFVDGPSRQAVFCRFQT